MSIDIHISGEDAFDVRAQMSKLLLGHSGLAWLEPPKQSAASNSLQIDEAAFIGVQEQVAADADPGPTPTISAPSAEKTTRKRRTKVEIETAGAQAVSAGVDPKAVADQVATEVAAISTGDERVGPEDAPEVQAQDAADEAAESAAATAEDPKLTHDDIRRELGAYMKKYGMAAAQEDGPKLFALVFPGAVPAKISDILDTQEALGKALAGIQEMSTKNPYQRAVAV